MRLVTRPDLDGLACPVLLSRCETIDAIALVHPQDVCDRRPSIFDRSCRSNLGVLLSLYGGGGHAGAAACLLPEHRADAEIADIVAALKRNG